MLYKFEMMMMMMMECSSCAPMLRFFSSTASDGATAERQIQNRVFVIRWGAGIAIWDLSV